MPTITVLPHPELCPNGATLHNIATGTKIVDALLDNNIEIEHACEKSCACTTCHIIVRQGFSSLKDASDIEEDLLDQAWGLEATSRLSCQASVEKDDLTIEIPKYTINHAREGWFSVSITRATCPLRIFQAAWKVLGVKKRYV